jgi:hypothetical protein
MSSIPHVPDLKADEPADLFDYTLLRHLVGFVFRAVGRHRLLSAGVFFGVLVLGLGVMALVPRTWHVEAKLLASRSQLIRSLGNPRTSGTPSEDPTRAADETVFARDNLLSLIQQTRLLERAEASRSTLSIAREWLTGLVFGPLTQGDRVDAMVGLLEKRLHVATDSQTVVIAVDWPDPEAAYQLVEAAQQNFLEARHVSEMTSISEALSILQVHATAEQEAVTAALVELERVRELRRQGLSALQGAPAFTELPPAPASGPARAVEPAAAAYTDPELAQLKFLHHSKRRALTDLEDFRARRLLELNTQLADQRVQYAERHPAVLDTVQRIAAMTEISPQIGQLRQELADLVAEYKRKGGQNIESLVEPTPRGPGAPRVVRAGPEAVGKVDLADDPEVEFARNTLRVASAAAEELKMRIDSARIEQDTTRAAFKYRYSVIRPASLPKKPIAPNYELLFVAVLGAALLLALFSGASLEWWRGLLVEPWQVSSQLGLKVLSDVKAP